MIMDWSLRVILARLEGPIGGPRLGRFLNDVGRNGLGPVVIDFFHGRPLILFMAGSVRAFPITLDMRHLITRGFVIGIGIINILE